jgi:hypothetical protein
MSDNILYKLAGSGISVTYETKSDSVELTLDESYSPFDGTHQVSGGDLKKQPTDKGVQLAGALKYDTVGRGGPIHKTSSFMLFLPESPEPTDSEVEEDATGAVVFADQEPRSDIAPAYRAESLTGTLSVPAGVPSG